MISIDIAKTREDFDRIREESIQRLSKKLQDCKNEAVQEHNRLRYEIHTSLHEIKDFNRLNHSNNLLKQAKENYQVKGMCILVENMVICVSIGWL